MAAFAAAKYKRLDYSAEFEVARQRDLEMIAIANRDNQFDLASSGIYASLVTAIHMREYQQAETMATGALELSRETSTSIIRQRWAELLSDRRKRN